MAYATVYQVAARNAARGTYTVSTIPTASQVIEYLLESAAQLDQWLYAGGYAAPFDVAIASGIVATSAQMLLQRWNVTGAALYVEEGAQQPINLAEFQKMWEEIKGIILDKSVDIPLPMNPAKANPRGPGGSGSLAQPNPSIFTFGRKPGQRDL